MSTTQMRTNAPGTCLYCGRRVTLTRWEKEAGRPLETAGPMGDGKFCTLKCASLFGAVAAANGYRLEQRQVTR